MAETAKHPQKFQKPIDCLAIAQEEGAQSYDAFGTACWAVYGKVIPITPTMASIMEGFEITNFNFHVNGTQRPVPMDSALPGPSEGVGSGGMLV